VLSPRTHGLKEVDKTLRGKRILLIGRDYFFYAKEIAAELEAAHGADAPFVPIVRRLSRTRQSSGCPRCEVSTGCSCRERVGGAGFLVEEQLFVLVRGFGRLGVSRLGWL